MKKITLFLSVLLMALVVKAQSEATATLVHTASSFCSTDKNAYTSTVDVEKEHVNCEFGTNSNQWNGAAYAEFSVTLPEGISIKSATLAWSGVGSSKDRTTDIMYVNAGEALDYETMKSTGTEKVNLPATKIATVTFKKSATTNFTTDVTDAVKTVLAAGQNYVIFKFTNNVGGGDLVGKGAAEKAPVLTLETVDASAMTTYTVKYVDESGNEIADASVNEILIGETVAIADENKVAIWNAGKTKKYIYKSCDIESLVTVADGTANIITATFREAEVYQYYVEALDAEENLLKTLAEGSNFEGETITVPYNQYILNSGVLYKADAISQQFNKSFSLTEDYQGVSVVYSKTDFANVVYFSEAEDIEGLTATTAGNANIRCSNSTGAYNASETPVEVLTLTPGTYTISAQIWGNTGTTFAISYGVDTLEVETKGYILSGNSTFTIEENSQVSILQAGSSTKCLDWILIQSSEPNSLLAVMDGQNFTAATATYAAATYTRMVNPAYNYGTICLPFAPNAATLENYTFYKLTATATEALTFEEVATPQAGYPYLYKAKDGEATTHVFIGGETTITEDDFCPYSMESEDGSWIMQSMYEEYTAPINNGGWMRMAYYAYKPTAEGVDVLVQATKSLTVKPYRAYFVTTDVPVATMRIVVRGQGDNGDGTTAIEEVITPDQIEGAVPATIYNLMGQPVAQPVKGQIYIVNGQKVVY